MNRPDKAACAGTCLGTCSGVCTALDKDGRCAGACDGTCDGRCVLPLFDAGRCDGDCLGECVLDNPRGGCKEASSAQCVVPGATGTPATCAGSCDGEVTAAEGNPACRVVAEVDAILNLNCRAGGASITAIPADAPEQPEEQARYFTALRELEHKLPHLFVLQEQAERLLLAGEDLKIAVRSRELRDSLEELNAGDINTRFAVGLGCAADQLMSVEMVLDIAGDGLAAQIDAVGTLRSGLGVVTP